MTKRRTVAVGLAACWLFVGPGEASAGEYPVKICGAAASEGYRSDAFTMARSSRDMLIDRDCAPGPGDGGVITRNRVARGKARYRSVAFASFDAPPGTVIRRMTWSGRYQRVDCDWSAQLIAAGPGFQRVLRGVGSGQRCPRRAGSAEVARFRSPRHLPVSGATRIVQRVLCGDRRGCATSATRVGARADFRTFFARVELADVQAPRLAVARYGLFSGSWVRGQQPVRLTAVDNIGIGWDRIVGPGGQLAFNRRYCVFAERIPCRNGGAQLTVDTGRAGDGTRALTVEVSDGAGNTTRLPVMSRIDNAPPGRVRPAVAGGDAWRRTPAFTVVWGNPPEADRAPIAGAVYRLRRAGSRRWGPRVASAGATSRLTNLQVPPGDWELTLWRTDAAGNQSEALASDPVHLRFDPESPQVFFERQRAADPARVAVGVTDRVSGLAGGEVELRRQGEAIWRSLRTQQEGSRLVARVDDGVLPPGIYAMRARAADRAGNFGFSDRLADGFPAVIRLPARAASTLTAGIVGRRTVRRHVRRNGGRRLVRRQFKALLPQARVRYRRRAIIAGRLVGPGGRARQNAIVQVLSRGPGGPEHELARLKTDAHGRFRQGVVADHSQRVRIVFGGSAAALPAQRELSLLVPASGALKASRRRVRNGQSVVFSGRVRTVPLPAAGKLIELQAHFRGRWRTFQTLRTNSVGRWSFRYRFGASQGRVRYRFRALLPSEAGYPYEIGVSRRVAVTVVGR